MLISLKNDYAFKELFAHENVRKQFLSDVLDGWIRLFNATGEEDLNMIQIKSDGIKEAIAELKTMSLSKTIRFLYEERLKARRDRWAEDEYVRKEGRAEGKAEDILLLLKDLGEVSPQLSGKIMSEKNPDVLSQWLMAAARAKSIAQFEAALSLGTKN